MSLTRRFAALAATATLAAGTALATAAPATAAPRADGPQWGPCPMETTLPLQCADVEVPVDYDDPSGPTMTVAISRLASTHPEKKRGVLLLNPGGPGGPGLDMPEMVANLGLPASVLQAYDLIGFDPRGIGHSSPITCDMTLEQQGQVMGPYADSDADVDAYAKVAKGLATQCEGADTGTSRHVTTENTARDMDSIRAALGEKKISYFGISYGTYLGAVYTQLFPKRSDRIVLDSAVGPSMVWRDEFRSWGKATEIRFPDLAKWLAARDGTYELGKTPAQVRRNFLAFADELAKEPVGGIDGSMFRQIMRGTLYGEDGFPAFAQTWQALELENGEKARTIALEAGLLPAAEPEDSSSATLLSILCNDASWPRAVSSYKKDVRVDRKRYPLVGAFAANINPCAFWQPPLDKTVEITDDGPANVLIPQNTRDPATIESGAVDLRRAFGKRARMVTVDGGGHGVYLIEGNACADNATTRFLLGGDLPAADQFCPAETSARTKADDAKRLQAIRELRTRQHLG